MIFDILCVVAIATLFAIGAEAWTRMLMNVEALRTKEVLDDTVDELTDVCMKKFLKEITKKNDKRKRK